MRHSERDPQRLRGEPHAGLLRERRADVLTWVSRLDARWRAQRPHTTSSPVGFDADVAARILGATWPENLRGLDRLVHTVAADGGGCLTERRAADLGLRLEGAGQIPDVEAAGRGTPAERPETPDRATLAALLDDCGGSIRAVARRLGRDRKQIYRWMERYGLKATDESAHE